MAVPHAGIIQAKYVEPGCRKVGAHCINSGFVVQNPRTEQEGGAVPDRRSQDTWIIRPNRLFCMVQRPLLPGVGDHETQAVRTSVVLICSGMHGTMVLSS